MNDRLIAGNILEAQINKSWVVSDPEIRVYVMKPVVTFMFLNRGKHAVNSIACVAGDELERGLQNA